MTSLTVVKLHYSLSLSLCNSASLSPSSTSTWILSLSQPQTLKSSHFWKQLFWFTIKFHLLNAYGSAKFDRLEDLGVSEESYGSSFMLKIGNWGLWARLQVTWLSHVFKWKLTVFVRAFWLSDLLVFWGCYLMIRKWKRSEFLNLIWRVFVSLEPLKNWFDWYFILN